MPAPSTTIVFQMNTQSNKWFWFEEGVADPATGPSDGLDSLAEILNDYFTEHEGVEYDPEDEDQWPSGYGALTEVEPYKYTVSK